MHGFCTDCDTPLTAVEAEYYEYRCERCERIWHERIQAWRKGERSEPEFDKQYGITGNSDGTS